MQHSEHLESLSSEAKDYIKNRIELLRLEFIDHSSHLFANLTAYVILLAISLVFLMSFGFFLGHWLGELLESQWIGFAIVAATYLIVLIATWINFRKWLSKPLQNFIIRKMEEYRETEIR